ncbi:hypothetical protein EVAR_2694_1 [Eumeta japonica]|uniref:Uncharacterized protein n=1 Tax=Eumeta variegata TaxID=151549 RepID=A0A4C1SPX8_EUMVA|nr:hypothetical protein EVAR_2694_1 [Eumeta japonica]
MRLLAAPLFCIERSDGRGSELEVNNQSRRFCHTSHVHIVVYVRQQRMMFVRVLVRSRRLTSYCFIALGFALFLLLAGEYWPGKLQIDKLLLHCSWLHALFLLLAGGQQPKQTRFCHTSHVHIVVYVRQQRGRLDSTGQESRRLTSNYIIALGFTRCSFLLAGGQQPKQARFCHTSHVHIIVYDRWNSSRKSGTDLRLGVRALLIIARLTVDEKKVQWRWFPCTVELSDEERYRLETWRTGAAHHRSTDCGREMP